MPSSGVMSEDVSIRKIDSQSGSNCEPRASVGETSQVPMARQVNKQGGEVTHPLAVWLFCGLSSLPLHLPKNKGYYLNMHVLLKGDSYVLRARCCPIIMLA